jgi:hypothetical protein
VRLLHLDVFRGFLALIRDELVFDYGALIERAQARSLHGGDMYEHIFAAALGLNEAICPSIIRETGGPGYGFDEEKAAGNGAPQDPGECRRRGV